MICRTGDGTYVLTRTPPMTREAVSAMRRSGMSLTEIAKVFLSTGRTVSKILEGETELAEPLTRRKQR